MTPNRPYSLSLPRVLILLIVTAAVAFLGGVVLADAMKSPHDDDNFQLFWQSWNILDREYYRELPADKELVYGAIQGLLYATGDRYTFFVPPQTAEFDRQATAGEFGGIGAYIEQNAEGRIVVAAPFKGFPAEKAGIQAGDIILEIDGESTQDLAQEDAIGLLRGDIGSTVTLTLYRSTLSEPFSVKLTRAKVELPTSDSKLYGDVGYLRLYSFNEKATSSLESEIADMKEHDVKALILDLRNNPGGLLDQAVGVSDLFLGDGVVVTQRNRAGDEIVYRSTDGGIAEDLPLVVLMDGGSASASEVVAGALHDRERATLIGQTSYGKGLVQHVHDMTGGAQLHITYALWYTPNETPIQGQGLKPDIEVTIPDDVESSDEDPFIAAALDYLRPQSDPK